MELLHLEPEQRGEVTAFEISELILMRAWSQFHDIRMQIELGCSVEGADCDEVIVLSQQYSSVHWMLWRVGNQVAVQPTHGESRRFDTISDALGAVRPTCDEELTDIHPGQ